MKLSEIVQRINGNIDRFTTELEFYIGGEHMESSELEISNRGLLKENLGKLGFKFHFAFQERDVLFMARNPHLRKAGMVMFSGLCSDATYVLRSKDENIISQEFLAIQLQTDHFWDYCERTKVGSVNFANNWSSIANYDFDLPPINIQKEVASKVWSAYRVKQSYRKLLNAIDEMVKSQFIEMFGSRDFLKRLGDYVSVKTGKLDANASVEGGRYPFFTCAEKTLSIDTYAFDCNAVLLAGNGEFCVKHYDGKFNAYQRTYVIESKDESILSTKYLYAWLKDYANILKANAIGGVIKYIKLGDIINAQINLPSQDRQLEYVKIYEQADKSKFELKKSIEAIDKVIKSIINNI